MCHTVSYVYAHCGSIRGSHVFPCEAGYDSTTGCPLNQLSTKLLTITAPSMCPNCYRLYEDEIHSAHDFDGRELQEAIERAMDDVKLEKHRHELRIRECTGIEEELEALREYRSVLEGINEFVIECQEKLEDNDEEKRSALRDFRAEQGVWGDG